MNRKIINLLKLIPLLILIAAFFSFFYFHLYRFLTFETLQKHRLLLLHWTSEHYIKAVMIYISLYTLAVAIAVPSVLLFTLAGGFLFGTCIGACYALLCDTMGAIFFFIAMRIALFEWFEKLAGPWLLKMEHGFQENAFNYLLTLRLIPIFPFWLINIISALLGVPLRTFVIATVIGLIPSTLIYTSVGHSLNIVFKENHTPNIDTLIQPYVLMPLFALAMLAIIPVIYKRLKKIH